MMHTIHSRIQSVAGNMTKLARIIPAMKVIRLRMRTCLEVAREVSHGRPSGLVPRNESGRIEIQLNLATYLRRCCARRDSQTMRKMTMAEDAQRPLRSFGL